MFWEEFYKTHWSTITRKKGIKSNALRGKPFCVRQLIKGKWLRSKGVPPGDMGLKHESQNQARHWAHNLALLSDDYGDHRGLIDRSARIQICCPAPLLPFTAKSITRGSLPMAMWSTVLFTLRFIRGGKERKIAMRRSYHVGNKHVCTTPHDLQVFMRQVFT